MPRGKRIDLAGLPQHVVQRGNDRQACFFRDDDYRYYLAALREAALANACRVHAYVLMTNHVHLLLTPAAPGAVARTLQSVGRRYVRHVNDTLGRTGTLWEGRYKSSLVDTDGYLLACYRYIELNPVRAGLAATAGDYAWSSFGSNGLGRFDALVSPHAVFLALDRDADLRRARYRELIAAGVSPAELTAIRLYCQRQRALGSDRFQAQISRLLARPAGLGRPGRPRKPPPDRIDPS